MRVREYIEGLRPEEKKGERERERRKGSRIYVYLASRMVGRF